MCAAAGHTFEALSSNMFATGTVVWWLNRGMWAWSGWLGGGREPCLVVGTAGRSFQHTGPPHPSLGSSSRWKELHMWTVIRLIARGAVQSSNPVLSLPPPCSCNSYRQGPG